MFYGDVDSGNVNTGSAGRTQNPNQDFVDNGANQVFSANTCVDCEECQPYGLASYFLGLLAFTTVVPVLFGGRVSSPRRKKVAGATSKKAIATSTATKRAKTKNRTYRKANDKITINVN